MKNIKVERVALVIDHTFYTSANLGTPAL
jgi:hypothetical protein